MLYEFGTWRVPAANSRKHSEIMSLIYRHINANRNKFSGIRASRFYTLVEKIADEETWMYLDEYTNPEDYRKMSKALEEDKLARELRAKWQSLIVSGSFRTELWEDFQKDLWFEQKGR